MSGIIIYDMNLKSIIYLFFFLLFFLCSCTSCKDDIVTNKSVVWKNRICGKSMIYDVGIGYPVYKSTVVFHSTPEPWGVHQSILHGLDINTGEEKWQLTNIDFAPKKDLQFNNIDYYYQNDNIFVGADFQYKDTGSETYIYAIDIEKGKMLWIKDFPIKGLQFGRMVVGRGKYAYVDFQKDTTEFSLIKIDIETGSFSEIFKFTKADIPQTMPEKSVTFDHMSQIYTDNNGSEYIAFSFNGYNYDKDRYKAYMTLCVYNLTQNKIAYTKYLNNQTLGKDEWDDVSGHICFNDGKILIGKGKNIYCYDAFTDMGALWQYKTGTYGNDNVVQVLGYDNLALGYTLENLYVFDINTGTIKYNVASSHSDAKVVDEVIYNEDNNDLVMRDVFTGKILKRIATGKTEEGFASTRPNVVDGKVFIHNGTDAYCIKAWGE
jgi:hypothetical protein